MAEASLDADTQVTHRDWIQEPVAYKEPPTAVPWTYHESDPALMLFTAAVKRFNMDFRMGQKILEIGCAESDWLERMHAMDPSLELVGIDARGQIREQKGFTLIQGDAMNANLFEDNTFDWIVLLGSLEHIGLGFYGDPVDEYGDTKTMENVLEWLKPGGFAYFDVPCQPTFRVSENRHFRSYAPHNIKGRLLSGACDLSNGSPINHRQLNEINRGYSLPEPWAGTWCHEPTEDRVPYWFVAVLAQKVA